MRKLTESKVSTFFRKGRPCILSSNSGSRKYKGTATIKARSTAGGASGTVTGAVGSSNDQLKVTVSSVSGYQYSDVKVTISQTGSIARSGSGVWHEY